MISLLQHELRVRRGSTIGWALGLGFFSVIYTIIYPNLPAEMREIDVRAVTFLDSVSIGCKSTKNIGIKSPPNIA